MTNTQKEHVEEMLIALIEKAHRNAMNRNAVIVEEYDAVADLTRALVEVSNGKALLDDFPPLLEKMPRAVKGITVEIPEESNEGSGTA